MKKVFVTVIAILCIMLVGCSGNNNPPSDTNGNTYEIIISDVIQVYVWKDNQIVPQLVNDKGEVIDARYDYVSSSDDITISYDGHITINSIPEDDVTVTITERNTGVKKNITLHFVADIQKVNAISKDNGEVATDLSGLVYNSKTTLNVITDQTDIDISSFCNINCTDKNGHEICAFDIEYNKNQIALTATGLGEGTLNIQINNSKGESLYQTSIPFSINWDEIALQNCVLNSVEKTLLSKEDITSIKSITIDEQVKLLLEVEHLSSLETIVIDSSEVQEFIYDSVIYNYRIKEHLYDDYYNHEFWANKQGNLIPYKNSTSENYIVYHSDRSTTMSVALITNTLAFPVLEFDGYTNIGWKNSSDKTVEASELLSFDRGVIHLYAIWEANGNRVVFNGNGATSGNMEDQVIATDSSANLTQNTYIRTGYTFIGWATTPTGAVTYSDCASFAMDKTSVTNLYAVWTPNENGVNFHANGGTGTMSVQSASTGETKALSQNQFTRSGYTFAGWSTTPTGAVEYADQAQYTMGADSSYTLYAVWTPIQYSISYNLAGGTDMGNQEQYNIESDQITLIAPTRSGYVFAGWTGEGITEPTKDVSITTGSIGHKTYTAVWAATVHFHANGGEGTIASVTVITNTSEYVLPKHTYTRDGYLFDGWSLSANGSIAFEKESVFTCGVDGEYHLYAVWNEGTEGLKFEKNSTGYSVVEYNGTSSEVIIPSQYRGIDVNDIAENVFKNNTYITSMVIPVTISEVSKGLLLGCSNLESLSLPYVFGDYLGYVFDGSSYSNNQTAVPKKLIKVFLTGNGKIEANAFYNCTNITSVEISGSVTSIGEYAFDRCSNLTNVILPENVGEIKYYVFRACNSLDSIHYNGDVYSWLKIDFGLINRELSGCVTFGKKLYFKNSSNEYELLTSLVIPDDVENISFLAFTGCSSLTSATIGSGVASIGDYAFVNCSNLKSIIVDERNMTYKSIDGNLYTKDGKELMQYAIGKTQKSFTIPNDVAIIGRDSFSGCANLTSVIMLDSVKSIDMYAFMDCIGLTSINIGNGVTSMDSSAFESCTNLKSVVISNNVIDIASGAFSNCTKLTSVAIGNRVSTIGRYAFSGCVSLENIVIPDNVKRLDSYVFSGCTRLTSITIGGGVTSIYDHAFANCVSLSSIVIPNSVKSIGENAFSGCSNLTGITIGNGITSIGYNAFSGCTNLTNVYVADIGVWCSTDFSNSASNPLSYANNLYLNNNLVTEFIIPEGVTNIGDYAFYNSTCFTSIVIPDTVKSIGDYAFSGCTGITSLIIGSGVTKIENAAFSGCVNLSNVTIGNNVTSLGWNVFFGCTSLTSIIIPDSVVSIGAYAFYNCENLKTVEFENNNGWETDWHDMIASSDLENATTAAQYLTVHYYSQLSWKRV